MQSFKITHLTTAIVCALLLKPGAIRAEKKPADLERLSAQVFNFVEGGKDAKAELAAVRLIEASAKSHAPDAAELLKFQYQLARAFAQQKKYNLARKYFVMAQTSWEHDPQEIAKVGEQKKALERQLGRGLSLAAIEKGAQIVLDGKGKGSDADLKSRIDAANLLAVIHLLRNDVESSHELYLQVLKLKHALSVVDEDDLIPTLYSILGTTHKQVPAGETRTILEEAMAQVERQYGKGNGRLVYLRLLYAELLEKDQLYEQAAEQHERIAAITASGLGELHPAVGENYLKFARSLELARKFDGAEQAFQRGSGIISASYGTYHRLVTVASQGLARIALERNGGKQPNAQESPVNLHPEILWQTPLLAEQSERAIVSPEGILLGDMAGNLYAFDKDSGKERWHYDAQEFLASGPFYFQGTLFCSTDGNTLHAVDAESGREKWKARTLAPVSTQIFTVTEKGLYFKGNQDTLSIIDTLTGRGTKPVNPGWMVEVAPLIANGVIYSPSSGSELFAIEESTRKRLWSHNLYSKILTTPIVTENLVITGTKQGVTYALNRQTGNLVWRHQDERNVMRLALAKGRDGAATVIVGDLYGGFYALDAVDGSEKWTLRSKAYQGGPYIVGDLIIVAHWNEEEKGAEIRALHRDTGEVKWRFFTEGNTDVELLSAGDSLLIWNQYELSAVDRKTGEEKWSTAKSPHSRVSYSDGVSYFGVDSEGQYLLVARRVEAL